MDIKSKPTAYRDGWLAHRNGVDVNANPYDENAQQRAHEQWMSGWCARFGSLKHGEWAISLDDEAQEGGDYP